KAAAGLILNARAPIPFKPFDRVDLKSGKPIAMVDAKGQPAMMTLPHGRSVVAKKYYDTLDKTEQQLKSIGRSRRQLQHLLVEVEPDTPRLFLQGQAAIIKSIAPNPA